MREVTAKGKGKEEKVEKLTVATAKKDDKLMKKIEKLEKKEQTKWVKEYVKVFNTEMADGSTDKKAAKAAEKAAFEVAPNGGKDKKGCLRQAYLEDRTLLAEAGEEVAAEGVGDFLMWCEASGIEFTAKDEMIVEFTDEEKAILGKATKAVIVEKDGLYVVTIESDNEEDGVVEISVSEGDDLEEEMEEMSEEIIEEGVAEGVEE